MRSVRLLTGSNAFKGNILMGGDKKIGLPLVMTVWADLGLLNNKLRCDVVCCST